VFKVGGKIFGRDSAADFGGKGFQAFARAGKIRDRLAHPKRSSDLTVSDDDLRDTDLARDWFRAVAKEWFEVAVVQLRSRIALLRRG
jgi:hypothetical protein